eukprot:tig00001001_g6206.t1
MRAGPANEALDAISGAERWRLPLQRPLHFAAARRAADGALLIAYSDGDGKSYALTVQEGKEAARVQLKSTPAGCRLAFARGGGQVISAGGPNAALCVNDAASGERKALLHRDGPPNAVSGLAAAPSGDAFLSTHSRWGGSLLWKFDATTGEWRKGPVALFARGAGPACLAPGRVLVAEGARVLAFDPEDARAAAAAGPVRLECGEDPEDVFRHSYVAAGASPSHDGSRLVANFAQSVLHVAELASGRSRRVVHAPAVASASASRSPPGPNFLRGALRPTPTPRTPEEASWGFVRSASCTDDGALVATGDGADVKVLDVATGAVAWRASLASLEGGGSESGSASVSDLAFGPGGARAALLAVAARWGRINIMRALIFCFTVHHPGGALLGKVTPEGVHFCNQVAWSHDGSALYVAATHHSKEHRGGTFFHVVRVARDGLEHVAKVNVPGSDMVSAVAVHQRPAGAAGGGGGATLLALGCMDGLVRLFEGPGPNSASNSKGSDAQWRLVGAASGRKGREVDKGWTTSRTEGIHGLAFSPCGGHLALAGGRQTGLLVFQVVQGAADGAGAGAGPLVDAAWAPGEADLTGVWFVRKEYAGRAKGAGAGAGRAVPGWTVMCSDRLGQVMAYRLHEPEPEAPGA